MNEDIRDRIEHINEDGFTGIVELFSDYVLIKPKGVRLIEIIEVRSKRTSKKGIITPYIHNVNTQLESPEIIDDKFLNKVHQTIKYPRRKRMYSKKDLFEYTKISKLNNSSYINFNILGDNFNRRFYNTRGSKKISLFSDLLVKITTDLDLIFKFYTFKSPSSNKEFSILFQPSKYLKSEKNTWMLISILGEKIFENELQANHSIVNANFIVNALKKADINVFLSETKNKIFSSTNERIQKRNPDVSQKKISSILKYLDIPQIETLFEKGEIKY